MSEDLKRQRDESPPRPARRGKWSAEEEAFAARLIRDFDAGLLPLENGATLRAFLSKKLNCSAMRISKKFAGEKCLGKQIFLRRGDDVQVKKEAVLLEKLEKAFIAAEEPKKPHKEPEQVLQHLSMAESKLGYSSHVAREARELAQELVDAHTKGVVTFDDLPKAESIQSPPAALMLELGPTPKVRQPHPTMGAYAFSIARGTSNTSLNTLNDNDSESSFFDDFDEKFSFYLGHDHILDDDDSEYDSDDDDPTV